MINKNVGEERTKNRSLRKTSYIFFLEAIWILNDCSQRVCRKSICIKFCYQETIVYSTECFGDIHTSCSNFPFWSRAFVQDSICSNEHCVPWFSLNPGEQIFVWRYSLYQYEFVKKNTIFNAFVFYVS